MSEPTTYQRVESVFCCLHLLMEIRDTRVNYILRMGVSVDIVFYWFITFTCNLYWLEIQSLLAIKAHDLRVIISRVFKIKFDELLKDLTNKQVSDKVIAYNSHISQ